MYSITGNEYIEQTVEKYSQSMLRAAYAILKNEADCQDAVQEAFLKLIYKTPEFKNEAHEKAWLLRVTINISKNMLKASHRKNLPIDEGLSVASQQNDTVLPCVMTLEEKYRTVLHLYYYEGYSIKEIAEILKLPAATVGTRLSRAREKLKIMLEGDFDL